MRKNLAFTFAEPWFRVVSKAQRREKIAGHYELSGDTMNSVGTFHELSGDIHEKLTFSSWKSSYWKGNSYSTASVFCFKQSYFSGGVSSFGGVSKLKCMRKPPKHQKRYEQIRQCVKCMNISPKKIIWNHTKNAKKNTHSLPPPISSPGQNPRWTLLDELDDGSSCVPRVSETADGARRREIMNRFFFVFCDHRFFPSRS